MLSLVGINRSIPFERQLRVLHIGKWLTAVILYFGLAAGGHFMSCSWFKDYLVFLNWFVMIRLKCSSLFWKAQFSETHAPNLHHIKPLDRSLFPRCWFSFSWSTACTGAGFCYFLCRLICLNSLTGSLLQVWN